MLACGLCDPCSVQARLWCQRWSLPDLCVWPPRWRSGARMSNDRHRSMIELLELDRGECLRLVAATSGRVGRVAVNEPGLAPVVRPDGA